MRRLMVAATFAAVALTAAACTDTPPSNGAAAPAAPSSTLSANSLQVCQAAEKVIGDSATKFGTDMVTATRAGTKGDATAQSQAMAAVKDALKSWADGLRQQAGVAEDSNLKSALSDMATEIDNTNNQITSVSSLQSVNFGAGRMKALSDRLTNNCR